MMAWHQLKWIACSRVLSFRALLTSLPRVYIWESVVLVACLLAVADDVAKPRRRTMTFVCVKFAS